jgi:PIF1-like helicase
LAADQQESLAIVLSFLRSYCLGEKDEEKKILRLTVSGVAGSGKSTWINTLVTTVRKIFHDDDVISVFAPTGCAAYNAGGETIHGGFMVPVKFETLEISSNKQKTLLSRFSRTLAIIVDERSQLDGYVLGIVKHYMQQCAHGGMKKDHDWGGVPIVILVGDDCQLPPILPGAFYALKGRCLPKATKMLSTYYNIRLDGFDEFMKIGKKVIYLEGEKRVNEGQDMLKRLLEGSRCEKEKQSMLETDVQVLLALHLSHPSFSSAEIAEIESEATYVFANKAPRDQLNSEKLRLLNKENPIARIRSRTVSNKTGKQVRNDSHYDADRTPKQVLISVEARVSLNGWNIAAKEGLFHGSVGIVRDIVFKTGESPNLNDLPAYVMVEFPLYIGKPFMSDLKQCIPIVPFTVLCKYKCCSRTFLPLALAYGKTAHTFQGQNVGPVPEGRPRNAIQKIIVDPGTRQFEGANVGLFYQLLSRATTIGTPGDKLSSAIYFDGKNFCRHRFENLTMQNANQMYKMAYMRKDWIDYLRENEIQKGQWSSESMQEIFDWANMTRISRARLTEIINTHK